ncbi:MAG: hypothetical protein ABWY12_09790 [Burkholderiales bacterium]
MGRTHFSGLFVGDKSQGLYSNTVQMQMVTLTANDVDAKLHFPERNLLAIFLLVKDATGVPLAVTGAGNGIKLGTTSGGTEILPYTASSATDHTHMNKVAQGTVYAQVHGAIVGDFPMTLMIEHFPIVINNKAG